MFLNSTSSYSSDNRKSLVYLTIVFIAFFVAVFLIWRFSKIEYFNQVSQTPPQMQVKTEEPLKPEDLTQEKIEEVLSQQATSQTTESPKEPSQKISNQEINKALQQKIPENERPAPLSQESINNALNQK